MKTEPTLRSLAKIAGVTATTVSMALRDHPRISKETCVRIKLLAKAHGYVPDPMLNRLLRLRQNRAKKNLKGSLCALHAMKWGSASSHYSGVVLESARARAKALGFSFDVLGLEELTADGGRMRRILRNRGVEGILITPLPRPTEFAEYPEWAEFSVVASSYSVLKPNFHRVVPHQFDNTFLICNRLVTLGYRRIGLMINQAYDDRVNHNCSAAVSWQSLLGETEFIRPLLFGMTNPLEAEEWFERERPDSILASGDTLDALGVTARQLRERWGIPVVSPHWFPGQPGPGINERPHEIGTKAVDVLASMILHGERGIPARPSVTMVGGELHGQIPRAPRSRDPAGRVALR